MKYDELIACIAVKARVPEEQVREVLFHLPDILVKMDEGEQARTPLGVFTQHRREERSIVLPEGDKTATVKETLICKLKPGVRLRRKPRD